MPSIGQINAQRQRRFYERLSQSIEHEDLTACRNLVEDFIRETEIDPVQVAAALARMLQGDSPLLLNDEPRGRGGKRWESDDGGKAPRERPFKDKASADRPFREKSSGDRPFREKSFDDRPFKDRSSDDKPFKERPFREKSSDDKPLRLQARPLREFPDVPMRRYRIEVGHDDQVKPGNIVGAIANEGELDSCYIGSVDIYDDFTLVDLPDGMPKEVLSTLRKARVAGKPMNLSAVDKSMADKGGAGKRQGAGRDEPRAPRPAADRKKKPKHQKRKGKPAPRGKRKAPGNNPNG
jgi:ATP-dependent RNA helicase DeaD